MEQVLNYIIESSLCLGVLMILYRLLFKGLNNLSLNRIYITSSMLFAGILPFLHFRIAPGSLPGMLPAVTVGGQNTYMLESIAVYTERTNQLVVETLSNLSWMHYLYISGLVLSIGRLFLGMIKLHLFKKRASLEKTHGFILVNTESDLAPFSFFNLLFINQRNYREEEYNAILHHEKAHIQLKHSFDILLLEFILIIHWFNPFAWMLRHDLKEVHEYQADAYTIRTGINKEFYKKLLLGSAMGTRIALGNNLNHSLIKKRLKMINNKISKSPGIFRLAAVALTLGMLTFVFACERDDQNVYTEVDTAPEFPGGIPALKSFMSENLEYPEDAFEKGISGKVFISFVVTKEGNVTDAQVVRGVDPLLDEEALRVVSLLKDWKPGIKEGKEVNVQYTLPVTFIHHNSSGFQQVEELPEFEGGKKAFQQYIREHILYPQKARENGFTGKALVSLTINEKGEITNVGIAETSGNAELDKEAVRVVESAPDWKPGIQHGEPVAVDFTIPIEFLMTDKGGAMVIEESNIKKQQMIASIVMKKVEGQYRAVGKILDAGQNPLKGAHVVVAGTTSGATTNARGEFELTLEKPDQSLVISYVGKETLTWHN